ncbi:MAG TPA: HAD family hydrolase [Bacillota bacterium]|nr:HAD family hydrolase [Bacillota bacterium]
MKVILFDLDGTLLDSEQVAREARNYGFQRVLGRSVMSEEEAFFLGKPVRKVLLEWFPDQAEELSSVIRDQYTKLSQYVQPYTGIIEMLNQLKAEGYTLGIVSSKRNHNIERELEVTGLAPYFDTVVGQDDTEKHKPDPTPLLLALNRLRATPESCTYIGDQPTDIQAAHHAGIRHIAVIWGDGDEQRFSGEIKTFIARTPQEVLQLFLRG